MWFRSESKRQWWIDDGIEDAARFFDTVRVHLPQATHFGVEGTRVSREARKLYMQYADPKHDYAPHDTLWPSSDRYTCRCTPEFWSDLIALARVSKSHDLLHHLTVQESERTLMTWHDAFAPGALTLDADVPESVVAAIAGAFGVRYGKSRW